MTDNPNYSIKELEAMGLSLAAMEGDKSVNPLYCSWCGKSDKQCLVLVAGPTVFICDECVELCVEVIAMKRAEDSAITIDQAAQSSSPNTPDLSGVAEGETR